MCARRSESRKQGATVHRGFVLCMLVVARANARRSARQMHTPCGTDFFACRGRLKARRHLDLAGLRWRMRLAPRRGSSHTAHVTCTSSSYSTSNEPCRRGTGHRTRHARCRDGGRGRGPRAIGRDGYAAGRARVWLGTGEKKNRFTPLTSGPGLECVRLRV